MPRDDFPGLTDAILERYEEEGPEKLAEEFGCSIDTVCSRAKRRGLKSKNRWHRIAENKKTDFQRRLSAAIKDRYAEEGALPIAEEFGVDVGRVFSIAFRLGIKSENHREHLIKSFVENNDNCNAAVFDEPLSSQAAYFLGLVWADGSIQYHPPVHTLALSLTEPEWHLLEDFREFLEMDGHIHQVRQRNPNHQRQMTVHVGNKRLVEQLMKLGIKQNKSNLDPPHPTCITDDVFHHWARGWLDGDGSISYGGVQQLKTPRITWYGTKTALAQLSSEMSRLAGVSVKQIYLSNRKLTDKCYGVGWSNWRDVKAILTWLHQDRGPYAVRKHARPIQQADIVH